MRTVALVGLLLAGVTVAFACGGGGGLGEIQTADGRYSITKVELGDRFPPDCSSHCQVGPHDCPGCDLRLREGYQMIAVSLEKEFEGVDAGLYGLCSGNEGKEGQMYITVGGYSGSCEASGTYNLGEDYYFILFTAPASARGFTLFVPDNPPVDLGK